MSKFRDDPNDLDVNNRESQTQEYSEADTSDAAREDALMDELAALIENITPQHFDEDRLNAVLAELHTAAPLDCQVDKEQALARFYEKYGADPSAANTADGAQQNAKPHKVLRFPLRKIGVIAAVLAIILASMATAQAFDLDLFGCFARWTNDVFYFTKAPAYSPIVGATVQVYPIEEGEYQEFESLDAAVEAFGIPAPLVPKWLPESVGELAVTATVSGSRMMVWAFPTDDEIEFYIDYTEGSEALIQKDDDPIQTYTQGGITHYLMTNGTSRVATWVNGDITGFIAATISEEEMKHIIDSIYEL